MIAILLAKVRPYFPHLAIGVVAFALGRYSLRASTAETRESETIRELTSQIEKLETSIVTKMSEQAQSSEAKWQTALDTKVDVQEKITITPDGTHTVERRKRSQSTSNSSGASQSKEQTKTEEKQQIQIVEKEKIVEKERIVEKVTKTPPPSWRVYGVYAIDDITDKRKQQYGGGSSYGLGPFEVGGLLLYRKADSDFTVGVTAGISF